MSDVARWKVHGAVETLKSEFAIWDLNRQEWLAGQRLTVTSFRPDGAVSSSDAHNPDGSIVHMRWIYDGAGRLTESNSQFNDGPIDKTVYSYDAAGRPVRTVQMSHDGTQTEVEVCSYDPAGKKAKVRFLGVRGANTSYAVEGSDGGYSAPGATAMVTTYDEQDLPASVIFQDANHNSLRTVTFIRDGTGKVLKEEMRVNEESPVPELLNSTPPERRAAMADLLKKVFGDTFSSTTYTYDSQGRVLERTRTMGNLSEDRTTFQYGEREDPIEETTEHRNREARIADDGTVQYTEPRVILQRTRFEYRYDAQGNWTERIVSGRAEENPDFQRSNIERRTIAYHAA